MEDLVLVGYGGHAKSVADCIECQGKYRIIGYTDNVARDSEYLYLGSDEVLEQYYNDGIKNAAVGVGFIRENNIRERLFQVLKKIGYRLPIIIDPSAVVSESAKIEEGSFVGKMAVVNAEARIGKMAIINSKALVEHECVIGDYSHIAVTAVLCGQAKIGKASFIGANSTILQCVELPDNVIVPAGITVRRNFATKVIHNATMVIPKKGSTL